MIVARCILRRHTVQSTYEVRRQSTNAATSTGSNLSFDPIRTA